MKKTLLALAVLGATAGIAHAQSNVQIYGIVDTGYIKESGSDTRMGSSTDSRIGFRGTEDLGGGLKATFELEQRLNLNDGTRSGVNFDNIGPLKKGYNAYNLYDMVHNADVEWKGAANLGLASNSWGAVRFGRVNNLGTESYNKIDPFNGNGIGSSLSSTGNLLYAEQLSNTARYDSPTWSGFSFGLSYTTKADDHNDPFYKDIGNHGWNINLQYDNGPLLLLGNFYRLADSDNSDVWNLGGAYKFGPARVSLGYQQSDVDYAKLILGEKLKQREGIVGLQWDIGPGQLNASYNYAKVKVAGESEHANKYAVGYTYNLSKRTAVYGVLSYLDAGDELLGAFYSSNHALRDSSTGVQIGMTHKF